MNKTYFGAIHYDIHLDMKFDYTKSRTFQEISQSELETIHPLCVYVNSNDHKFAISPTRSTKYLKQDIYYQAIDQIKQNRKRYNNIDGIENKITRFQIYPETELARNYITPFYKTQVSEVFVKNEKGFDSKTGKLLNNPYPTYHNKNCKKSYIPFFF